MLKSGFLHTMHWLKAEQCPTVLARAIQNPALGAAKLTRVVLLKTAGNASATPPTPTPVATGVPPAAPLVPARAPATVDAAAAAAAAADP